MPGSWLLPVAVPLQRRTMPRPRRLRALGASSASGAAAAVAVAACTLAVASWCFSCSVDGAFSQPGSTRSRLPSRRSAAGLLASGLLLPPRPAAALSPEELAVVAMFEKTSPGVLSISDKMDASSSKRDGGGIIGSGFAWDQNHVVTTASMMRGVSKPMVTVLDRDSSGAEQRRVLCGALVGTDPVADVAVLWVDGEMKPLHCGSSEDLMVGQQVFALGNPMGMEHSLSKGVISGVSRTMVGASGRPLNGIIQTDAAINPGNNGGPLLDSSGTVIGVNNAILTTSGTSSGVGLAIPIDSVVRSVTSVILKGFVQAPSMGVVLEPDEVPRGLGLDGVMVRQVDAGGPAQTAGVRPMRRGYLGDLIVGVNSRRISNTQDFFKAMEGKLVGEDIVLSVQRAAADQSSDSLDQVDIRMQLGSKIL
mmetsp:Transcript_126985/g.270759  ORF Transcript_126985/g.270759 Transcript_126985/m.270759 type:complete len:421 (+) Transcript_126985:50-1312(+)